MAFSDKVFRGAMLVLLDGSDAAEAPRVDCHVCKRPLLRVFITLGARSKDSTLERHQDACITKKWVAGMPCPRALRSVTLIDKLMDAARS